VAGTLRSELQRGQLSSLARFGQAPHASPEPLAVPAYAAPLFLHPQRMDQLVTDGLGLHAAAEVCP
jgi:hypothetical protein